MQVSMEDVLKEYREHSTNTTDDLLMHKAALKNAEKQIAQLQEDNARLKAALPTED